ncbi:unnamed protein product [Prunus armeniaca]|uniref:Uncharacterized protein n=1 Tax=Prunus armeniaca TaxID=36596 RepID=A0A6J5VLV7_PRUAR|nr:unnamed protein product [Prunus armeniaca]
MMSQAFMSNLLRQEKALGKHGFSEERLKGKVFLLQKAVGTDYGKNVCGNEGIPGVTGSIAWENSGTTIVLKWTNDNEKLFATENI